MAPPLRLTARLCLVACTHFQYPHSRGRAASWTPPPRRWRRCGRRGAPTRQSCGRRWTAGHGSCTRRASASGRRWGPGWGRGVQVAACGAQWHCGQAVVGVCVTRRMPEAAGCIASSGALRSTSMHAPCPGRSAAPAQPPVRCRLWCGVSGCASLCGGGARASCPRAPSPWRPASRATRYTWSRRSVEQCYCRLNRAS